MEYNSIQKCVGQRVKKLRENRKMLQKSVADAIKISVSSYAKLESGERGISSENCIALADLFGVSCDYILRGIESENIDICTKTALNPNSINVLTENKNNEVFWLDDYDETNVESIYQRVTIKEYSISNEFLNRFICDKKLWEELRRACLQYISCLEEIFENYDINDGMPSVEEALNMMGLDASKYIAGQAFGEFFSRVMKDANFIRTVSGLNDAEIKELACLDLINYYYE